MTVDEYLSQVPDIKRRELQRIRTLVKQSVPEAEECISYGMPAFKLHGHYLIGYAAFKDHMSLFPTSFPIAELKDELHDYKLSKGTIQFTNEKPLSDSLLFKIIEVCVASRS